MLENERIKTLLNEIEDFSHRPQQTQQHMQDAEGVEKHSNPRGKSLLKLSVLD